MGVKAVCCAPGLSSTNLFVTAANDNGFMSNWLMYLSQSPEDGALPLLIAGLGLKDPSEKETVPPGGFIEPWNGIYGAPKVVPIERLSKICTDADARSMLWKESEAACGEFTVE